MSGFLFDPKDRQNYRIIESSFFPGVRGLLDPNLEKEILKGASQKFNIIATRNKWGYVLAKFDDAKLKYKREKKEKTIPVGDFKLVVTKTLMDYIMLTLSNPPDIDSSMIVRVSMEGKIIRVNPILGWMGERL